MKAGKSEEEMEEKYVDKDIIRAITSFFKDNYLKNNSLDIHVDIIATAAIEVKGYGDTIIG